jgi:predicted RNA-binding Zn ribbon-like protein
MRATPDRPRHTADGQAFRFRAGRASLDLCATLLWRHRAPVEQLGQPEDVSRWLMAAGLCEAPVAAGERDLTRLRSLREAIYRLVHAAMAGDQPAEADTRVVNAAAARPGRAPQLSVDRRVTWVSTDPLSAGLSEVARDCLALITGPSASRIRECAAPDCAFLFVDTSRPGNRRWCAMNRCGNRQHVREHRSRRASHPAGASAS